MIQRRALITDGNKPNRSRLKSILLLRGFTVEEADDSAQALSLLTRLEFQVVFSDIVLGPTSGFDLLSQIRRSVKTNGVPVILISEQLRPEDTARGNKLGCSGYLLKPFNTAKLDEALVSAGLFGATSGAFKL